MTECFAFGNGLTAIGAVGRKGRGGRGSRVWLRHITCLAVDKACERGNCNDIRNMHGNRAARYSTIGCNKTVLLRGPIEGMPTKSHGAKLYLYSLKQDGLGSVFDTMLLFRMLHPVHDVTCRDIVTIWGKITDTEY